MGEPVICVVEDNASDVYLLRLVLEEHHIDCKLLVFSDGEQALNFVLKPERIQPEPSLFIVDLNLPKIDGREILRHLRSSALFRTAPIIVWTSSDSERDRQISVSLNANRHVLKPSNVSAFIDLGSVIKELLPAAG